MTFGEYVSSLLVEQELSDASLAAQVGISKGYLCDIKKDRKKVISEDVLFRLSDVLCSSPAEKSSFFDLYSHDTGEIPLDVKRYLIAHPEIFEMIRGMMRMMN